jgi:hypothetical protein
MIVKSSRPKHLNSNLMQTESENIKSLPNRITRQMHDAFSNSAT